MIYLASPYSHSDPMVVGRRFKQACRAAALLMEQGEFVFSPIAHSHPIAMEGNLLTSWEYWRKYDREFIGMCDRFMVLKLHGWEGSNGIQDEISEAMDRDRKIEYVTLTELEQM